MAPIRMALSALIAAGSLGVVATTAQASPPNDRGIQLVSPDQRAVLTVHGTGPDQWIEFNPSVYLESGLNQFELDVRRMDARQPITATVKVGSRSWPVPQKLIHGWTGLRRAFAVTWRTVSGRKLAASALDWCPNDGGESRLSSHGSTTSAFAYGCGGNPFTRGQRWGIDRGWARQVLAYNIIPPAAISDPTIHEVRLDVGLDPTLAQLLGIRKAQSTVHFVVTIKRVIDGPVLPPTPGQVRSARRAVPGVQSAATSSRATAPTEPFPGGAVAAARASIPRVPLPDLIALPAWGIATHNESGHDLLDFSATVYNGGPGPLVVEGFRSGSRLAMSAYQFFYRGSRQVGLVRVGAMHYDARPTHQHWHFQDFAKYDLIDNRHRQVRTSGKEAFCLAPTDAIDLLAPGAVPNPGNGDLSTACGDITSIWVREVLASGWGDTYSQQRAGQSIDITGLPNGSYWIRVSANPADRLYETTRSDNVSLRHVILGGVPGSRTVRVPNYGLINSETP